MCIPGVFGTFCEQNCSLVPYATSNCTCRNGGTFPYCCPASCTGACIPGWDGVGMCVSTIQNNVVVGIASPGPTFSTNIVVSQLGIVPPMRTSVNFTTLGIGYQSLANGQMRANPIFLQITTQSTSMGNFVVELPGSLAIQLTTNSTTFFNCPCNVTADQIFLLSLSSNSTLSPFPPFTNPDPRYAPPYQLLSMAGRFFFFFHQIPNSFSPFFIFYQYHVALMLFFCFLSFSPFSLTLSLSLVSNIENFCVCGARVCVCVCSWSWKLGLVACVCKDGVPSTLLQMYPASHLLEIRLLGF